MPSHIVKLSTHMLTIQPMLKPTCISSHTILINQLSPSWRLIDAYAIPLSLMDWMISHQPKIIIVCTECRAVEVHTVRNTTSLRKLRTHRYPPEYRPDRGSIYSMQRRKNTQCNAVAMHNYQQTPLYKETSDANPNAIIQGCNYCK